MTLTRRASLALPALLLAHRAHAQALLDRPARILVGYPPGGATDVFARLHAERLTGSYAPAVVVENRPGASARLAAEALRASPPDGATLLCTPESVLSITPHIHPATTRYDSLADFVPVAPMGVVPFAFAVNADHPAQDVAGFVRWAAAQSEVAYSSPASGSTPHLLAALMARRHGLPMQHISYRGTGAALVDLTAGRLSGLMATLGDLVGQHRGGAVRILAVTAAERLPRLPEVPSFAEAGLPELTAETWNILVLPARAPEALVTALAGLVARSGEDPALRARMEAMEAHPGLATPQQLATRLAAEHARWGTLVREIGFTGD